MRGQTVAVLLGWSLAVGVGCDRSRPPSAATADATAPSAVADAGGGQRGEDAPLVPDAEVTDDASDAPADASDAPADGVPTVVSCSGPLVFASPLVEQEVRRQVHIATGPVLAADVAGVTSLAVIGGHSATQLASLAGLECLTALTEFRMDTSLVTDLTPLAALPLHLITATGGPLEDLTPLSHLVPLDSLFLMVNHIRDLSPLEPLLALRILLIEGNPIQDYSPLLSLPNLEALTVSGSEPCGTPDPAFAMLRARGVRIMLKGACLPSRGH